jgi:mannose-6-phosphate isomerase class I
MIITQMGGKEMVKAVNGPSTMIVTSGSGIMRVSGKEVDLSFGFIFIGQGVDVEFETKDEKVMVHRVYAE